VVAPAVVAGPIVQVITVYMAATGIRTIGPAMAVIRLGLTDRIVLIVPTDRNHQVLSPDRKDQPPNLWPDPDHRQAWGVPAECREVVVDRFKLYINLCVRGELDRLTRAFALILRHHFRATVCSETPREGLFCKRLFLPLHQTRLLVTRAAQLSVTSIMWALNCSGPP